MTTTRKLILFTAVLAIALCWWQIGRATAGLVTRTWVQEGVPLYYAAPAGAQNVPGVVIAHGFSGSNQLMRGYSYVLAHAGYATISMDLAGHGANPRPLAIPTGTGQRDTTPLQANLDTAYAALLAQGQADPERIAVLGHSMGSGVAMTAGIDQPERYSAVVAISPTGASVTPALPRNLHLQAGQLEPPFVANAERLLAEAGGSGPSREFVLIPHVEHISILFSRTSHAAVRDWLDGALGHSSAGEYVDRRMGWYGVHLAAVLVLAITAAPLLSIPPTPAWATARPKRGLLLAPLGATAGMALLGRGVGVDLTAVGGLLVGGAVALWLGLFGLVWLAVGFRPSAPQVADVGWGLAILAVLTLAFGLLGQVVWVPWWLIGARLGRWVVLWLACVPWALAAAVASHGAGRKERWGWWLGHSLAAAGGLVAAVLVVPGLGFVVLVVPLLPPLVGLMGKMGQVVRRPWAAGLGNAAFFAWLLAAVFPLAGG